MTTTSKNGLSRTLSLGAALVLAAGAATAATEAPFPSKPVRIIVQYQAGGSTDILARLVAEGLSKRLGQPVVVENRSGAGGIIGTDYVAKSPPDGYTLLLTVPGPVTANLVLYSKLPYDPRTDLRMVSDIATTRTVLAVHPSVQATDFKSLVATVGSITTLQPYIKAGKLRPLAVAGTRRARALPDVPTFAEQGYADEVYAMTGPTSLMAPAKTPDAVIERLGREVSAVVRQPEVSRR